MAGSARDVVALLLERGASVHAFHGDGPGSEGGYAPARYLAIALFGLTIVKVMTKDIAELDRVYQMLSVLALGALLVVASYLYQRMATQRTAPPREM